MRKKQLIKIMLSYKYCTSFDCTICYNFAVCIYIADFQSIIMIAQDCSALASRSRDLSYKIFTYKYLLSCIMIPDNYPDNKFLL